MANAECGIPKVGTAMTAADATHPDARRKAVWGSSMKIVVALAMSLAALMALTSCSDAVRTGQSSSYLILQSMSGGASNTAVVQSDVFNSTPAPGSVLQDNGTATIQVSLKDPLGSSLDRRQRDHDHAVSRPAYADRRPQHTGRGRALRI